MPIPWKMDDDCIGWHHTDIYFHNSLPILPVFQLLCWLLRGETSWWFIRRPYKSENTMPGLQSRAIPVPSASEMTSSYFIRFFFLFNFFLYLFRDSHQPVSSSLVGFDCNLGLGQFIECIMRNYSCNSGAHLSPADDHIGKKGNFR